MQGSVFPLGIVLRLQNSIASSQVVHCVCNIMQTMGDRPGTRQYYLKPVEHELRLHVEGPPIVVNVLGPLIPKTILQSLVMCIPPGEVRRHPRCFVRDLNRARPPCFGVQRTSKRHDKES